MEIINRTHKMISVRDKEWLVKTSLIHHANRKLRIKMKIKINSIKRMILNLLHRK